MMLHRASKLANMAMRRAILPGLSRAVVNRAVCAVQAVPMQVRCHGQTSNPDAETILVTFVLKDGSKAEVKGELGDNILEVAHKNAIDLEGACECSIACSTCHVYVDDAYFDLIPEACEDEDDMLDMAFALRDTSRLGCQIELTKELDGMTVTLPQATRNFYVDGHVPQPH